MIDQLESIVEIERPNLASTDKVALRDTISSIEAKICSEETRERVAEGSSSRNVLLHLIKVGIELQNADLLLILVARLKLGQVALVLQSTLQLPGETGKLFTLSYVAEHFHLDAPKIKEQLLNLNHKECDTIYDLKSLVNLYIESNEWKKASEFTDNSKHGKSLNRLICSKLGQQYEAMENFYEALVNYETSETQLENSVRVIIKEFLDSSRAKLREYCLTNDSLKKFWNDFSLFCSQKEPQNCRAPQYRPGSGLLVSNPALAGDVHVDGLPERVRKFISESSSAKSWLNRRTLDSVISGAASIEPAMRRQLLKLATQYWQSKRFPRACAFLLCLGESVVVSQLSLHFLSLSDVSQLNLILGLPDASTMNVLRLIRTQTESVTTIKQTNDALKRDSIKRHDQESLFFSALNLGLIDETIRFYCDVFPASEDATKQILDSLENLIATRHTGSLDRVDPTIRPNTLAMVSQQLASERLSITPVTSIIIYCMAIYTYKLDNSHSVSIPMRVIRKLEIMFRHTSNCMRGYNFDATSSLVRPTSILVTAIKDKLDIVSDSEIIRVGVKELVESVASRCLVESQFKQAATLYSQIEDHPRAIKSLMRLGDIDTVTNYSLLVRDITVQRLTINYLKHLEVDSRIIEEFITKSKL